MDVHVNMKDFLQLTDDIGPDFERRSIERADSDQFIAENVAELKRLKFYSAMVPRELGGGGVSHSQMCAIIRNIGGYCPSTALTLSMHQHIIAANRWNHEHGNPGQAVLEMVAKRELVLVSTGATDWLSSVGVMEKVDGGFLVSAQKRFASGSPSGDILVTSAPYDDPEDGPQVLHFPVPLNADGVSITENWQAMGMRHTGSHVVVLDKVLVPDAAIAVRRPKGAFHPMWSVVLTVAMPLIMSAYMGLAERAAEIARAGARNKPADGYLPYILGEMENALTTASVAYEGMVAVTSDLQFDPRIENADAILKRKSVAARAVMETTSKAVEASGGAGFMRQSRLEQLYRDSLACQFHPLAEKKQQLFSGRLAMGLDPVAVTEGL